MQTMYNNGRSTTFNILTCSRSRLADNMMLGGPNWDLDGPGAASKTRTDYGTTRTISAAVPSFIRRQDWPPPSRVRRAHTLNSVGILSKEIPQYYSRFCPRKTSGTYSRDIALWRQTPRVITPLLVRVFIFHLTRSTYCRDAHIFTPQ
jgi:hypothetical protein